MKLNNQIKTAIDRSILCWLATASCDGIPNVSPKEIFNYYTDDYIIIANIASPETVKNIKQNKNVSISFIDILVQKGFQLKGTASLISHTDPAFASMNTILTKMTKGQFPFSSIIAIKVEKVKPILAPSYLFYTDTTEEEQIDSARKRYLL